MNQDTWITSNKGAVLTGNSKNQFTPVIQFADGDDDGNVLATKYRGNAALTISEQLNHAPVAIGLKDIAVYENSKPSKINLFDAFEDDYTSDEDLVFTVVSEPSSLFSSRISEGLLNLIYFEGAIGEASVTVTATDNKCGDAKIDRRNVFGRYYRI